MLLIHKYIKNLEKKNKLLSLINEYEEVENIEDDEELYDKFMELILEYRELIEEIEEERYKLYIKNKYDDIINISFLFK